MAKKISQLTQATEVKSDDVTVIVQDGETKKLPLNMMVTKQDIEDKKVVGLAKLDEIEATYENDTYTPTITVKNKSSVKVGESDGVDYSANVMDGPAKSAILKGQTLVNTWDKHETHNKSNFILHDDGFMELKPNVLYLDHIQKSTSCLKPNTKYLLIVEVKDNTLPNEIYLNPDDRTYFYNNETVILYPPKTNGVTKTLLTTISDFSTTRGDLRWGAYIRTGQNNVDESERGTVKIRQMLIEYQDGMENWDIPYFTGMQSVKMPVLTTTGKNLFDKTKAEVGKLVQFDGSIIDLPDYFCSDYIRINKNKSYYKSGSLGSAAIYNQNKDFIRRLDAFVGLFTVTDNDCYYMRLNGRIDDLDIFQLEEGTQATPYEPYKTNILTVNEDVTLRSNGSVCDELDLLTGKLTQRIDEDGEILTQEVVKTVDLIPSGTHPSTTPYCWKDGHIQLSSSGLLPSLEYSVVTSRAGQISQNAAMIVKNDKRIFDLEILLAGGLVNTTYQALTLQNQVETGLSKVSLSSEKEPDYLLYHMIMKLIEEKAYKLDDLAEKVSVFYLYEKLSDEQFETIYSELYPFVEEEHIELPEDGEIIEEPIVDEVLEEVENGVVM